MSYLTDPLEAYRVGLTHRVVAFSRPPMLALRAKPAVPPQADVREVLSGWMPLDDPKIDKLIALILDTFRVRADQDPVYVDIRGHLERVAARQHQVIFGRRGSGKSCLLVHYHRNAKKQFGNLSIYVLADEVKTLPYPDLLIRLLLTVFESVAQARRNPLFVLRRPARPLQQHIEELRTLLDDPLKASVERGYGWKEGGGATAGAAGAPLSVTFHESREESGSRVDKYVQQKQDHLERHLQDYKGALRESMRRSGFAQATVLVDDFYLIPRQLQPDVIDYLHRLLRDTPLYLKVATVRHRTTLSRRNGATVGVELYQDVEEINLDQTIEDVDATREYLTCMLDSMGKQVGLASVASGCLSPDGLLHLTLASGGVPRDFLSIFVNAVEAARGRGALRWLTPTTVYKGAGRLAYRTKLSQLRGDLGEDARPVEKVFTDLTAYCLREKRKTAFLISQDEVRTHPQQHELIQQLMDFKLIHVIEPDTSAASGRPGRYEAYTLDFAIFMEPRLRNIDHVEFWKIDEQRRRQGVREAPVYPLDRAAAAVEESTAPDPVALLEEIEDAVGTEPDAPESGDVSEEPDDRST